MEIELKYGHSKIRLNISERARTVVLSPNAPPPVPDPVRAMERALDEPIGAPPLDGRKPPRTVAVAVPDETRPVPVKLLLPILLRRIFSTWGGLKREDVSIVIGGGLHAPMDDAAVRKMVPPEASLGCPIILHDALKSETVDFGTTSRGTPVKINAVVGRADFKAVIGLIDPHQFQGFTGGAKGIVIGCASPQLIEHNHGFMLDDRSRIGVIDGNPAREDLNEAGRLVGVDLAVNVNLDPDKRIVRLLCGEPVAVLREGARTCASIYGVGVDELYDIVVASCGGHPKDICLYQAQKGLNMASEALKPGGRLLLLASCDQGVGDDRYYDYVKQFKTVDAALDHFKGQPFRMGAHKSFLFGRTLTRFDVVVGSELEAETLNTCHLAKGEPQATIDRWIDGFPGRPRVAVVPNANTTYFYRR